MRSSARCCQRLFCVFALCLAVVACDGALSETPSAPSDAAEASADAQQTREAAEHMVFHKSCTMGCTYKVERNCAQAAPQCTELLYTCKGLPYQAQLYHRT